MSIGRRIYTYPSAWYFDDDPTPRNRAGGNNGNSNGNENALLKTSLATDGTPMNTDEERIFIGENRCPVGGSIRISAQRNENGIGKANGDVVTSVERREMLGADALMPYVLQGVADAHAAPDRGAGEVARLLVHRLPWRKRALDIVGAAAGLVIFSPVMILSAILVKGTSRGPVIFRQVITGTPDTFAGTRMAKPTKKISPKMFSIRLISAKKELLKQDKNDDLLA